MWPPDWGSDYDDAKETIPWPESEAGYIRIRRGEFKGYITEDLACAVRTWNRIKKYGWPQGKGYGNEPAAVLEIVQTLDAENEVRREFNRNKGNG